MTPDTDERRARALLPDYQEFVLCGDDQCKTCLDAVRIFARAIRASDEAAGMVLVPRDATIEMIVAGTETWLCKAAMEDRAEACWGAMIAATEAQE